MYIIGYKCFNENLTNKYGFKFEIGKLYTAHGTIKFGNNGNGFHLCKNMEDTLRYFDAFKNSVTIAEVLGSGKIVESFDDYYEYYNMYVTEKLRILKILTREEIINIELELNLDRVERFLSGFKLSKEEIELFKNKFNNNQTILQYIEYYQKGNIDAFINKRGSYNG